MPIYEYRCESCEHVFEELQRYNDPEPEACPKCEKSPVRRLISNTTFHLKGGGWYATDNPPSSSSSSSSAVASTSTAVSTSADAAVASEPASVEPVASVKESTKIEG